MKGKWVKLYLVTGINEADVDTKLKNIDEVQEVKWIPVAEFLGEALKFGMANPHIS